MSLARAAAAEPLRIAGIFAAGLPWYRVRIGRLALDVAACLAVSAILVASAFAQGAAPLPRLELNRLEPQGENCRAYLLVDNSRGDALRSLKLDLFAFDTEGVAQKRLALEVGPLAERKTSMRLFDFPGIACARVGRILLNEVIACESASGPREGCAAVETTSKGAVPFVK